MVPSLVFFSLNDSTLVIVVFWIPLYLHSAQLVQSLHLKTVVSYTTFIQ